MANKKKGYDGGNAPNGYDGANAPVVIFFGQSAGGKTTALVRLIRFLNGEYKPRVSEAFHNHYYGHRKDITFDDIKNEVEMQLNAPSYGEIMGTKERALVNIIKREGGNYHCRFLEVPGEDFVDLHNAGHIDAGAARTNLDYLEDAMSCRHKKIWVFFFDVDFTSTPELEGSKDDYVNAMKEIEIGSNDKIIVLLNKVDKVKIGDAQTSLSPSEYESFINENFNKILKEKPFSTKRWSIFGLRDPYNRHFELLGYSSFHFKKVKKIGVEATWEREESEDKYPKALWNTIDRAINNRF